MTTINTEALRHAVAASSLLNPRSNINVDDAEELIQKYLAYDASQQVTNFDRVSNWLATAGKEKTPANLATQVGVHLEEVSELLEAITITSPTGAMSNVTIEAKMLLEMIGDGLKKGHFGVEIYDREAVLDALCDADVTGNGIAYLAGFDKNGADKEVLNSNDSKFENGKAVILEGGKIGKGAQYFAPDLSKFV